MTFGFGFCSVLYGVWVRFGFLHIFIFGFEFGSVLGKTWVLVRFVLAGFGFFPISSHNSAALPRWAAREILRIF